MSTRRGSASAGHINTLSPSNQTTPNHSSSRIHRSTDSHGFTAIGAHSSAPYASSAISSTPQQKVIHVLINRLKNKVNTGHIAALDRTHSAFLSVASGQLRYKHLSGRSRRGATARDRNPSRTLERIRRYHRMGIGRTTRETCQGVFSFMLDLILSTDLALAH